MLLGNHLKKPRGVPQTCHIIEGGSYIPNTAQHEKSVLHRLPLISRSLLIRHSKPHFVLAAALFNT